MYSILIHTLTPRALSLQGKKNTCVSAILIYTHIRTHIHTSNMANTHTQAATVTQGGIRRGVGEGWGFTRRLYVRLRVWKILDIWSMTGPVSGSFIHWVLFRGFSSMSSNAAHKHKTDRVCKCTCKYKCKCKYRNMKPGFHLSSNVY